MTSIALVAKSSNIDASDFWFWLSSSALPRNCSKPADAGKEDKISQ